MAFGNHRSSPRFQPLFLHVINYKFKNKLGHCQVPSWTFLQKGQERQATPTKETGNAKELLLSVLANFEAQPASDCPHSHKPFSIRMSNASMIYSYVTSNPCYAAGWSCRGSWRPCSFIVHSDVKDKKTDPELNQIMNGCGIHGGCLLQQRLQSAVSSEIQKYSNVLATTATTVSCLFRNTSKETQREKCAPSELFLLRLSTYHPKQAFY